MKNLPARGLIVQPPYAGLLVDGIKDWEMRSRRLADDGHRGRTAIIEAGTGTLIGEANLVGSEFHTWPDLKTPEAFEHHRVPKERWDVFYKWQYAWVFENAVRYATPVKYDHPSGAQSWVCINEKVLRIGL